MIGPINRVKANTKPNHNVIKSKINPMMIAKKTLEGIGLQIEQPKDGFVVYTLNESEYELNVLGETSDADQSEGGNVNND